MVGFPLPLFLDLLHQRRSSHQRTTIAKNQHPNIDIIASIAYIDSINLNSGLFYRTAFPWNLQKNIAVRVRDMVRYR
jgi:hypothetical protein